MLCRCVLWLDFLMSLGGCFGCLRRLRYCFHRHPFLRLMSCRVWRWVQEPYSRLSWQARVFSSAWPPRFVGVHAEVEVDAFCSFLVFLCWFSLVPLWSVELKHEVESCGHATSVALSFRVLCVLLPPPPRSLGLRRFRVAGP